METSKYIYRYRCINKYFLAELADNKFYFASPSEFNDPFDCKNVYKFASMPDDDLCSMLKRYSKHILNDVPQLPASKKKLSDLLHGRENNRRNMRLRNFEDHLMSELDGYGLLCLSQNNDNILMWSHYADSHKGVCLIFDYGLLSKKFHCCPVKYSNEYPKFTEYLREPLDLNPLLLSKSKQW